MNARTTLGLGTLVVAALFTAGCATFASGSGAVTSAPPSPGMDGKAGDVPASSQPQEFEQRQPLGSCGEIELGQGERIPESAIACMDAAGVSGAELVVSAPTVEGDLVVSYYRVLPGGGVEIYTDSTLDKFAGEGSPWNLLRCPQAQSILGSDMGECTSEEL